MMDAKIEKMLNIGNEWEKSGMHRIYFNNLPELYGLKISDSGNTLDGEPISNTQTKKLLDSMAFMRIWFDFSDGQIHGKWNDMYYNEKAIFKSIVAEIRRRIS